MTFPLPPFIVRNFVYPLYRGFRQDNLLRTLEELERNQWLSPEELEDLQWGRLKALLAEVTAHVPYYRDLFREKGLSVDDIEGPADFRRIPFLTKDIIRGESKRLVTENPLRKGFASSTGGSTGAPLYFYGDEASGPVRRANTLRCYRWAGVDIGDRQAFLWGTSLNIPLKKRLIDGVKHFFNNILYLSTFDLSTERMESYLAQLKRFRPAVLTGYPSALEQFARFCRGKDTKGIGLRAVVTSGEELFGHQRELIEEAFSVPVFNRYGSREFSNVAHECEVHRGLHVFSDLYFVEVVDEDGEPVAPGETGELVITDLTNFYMPFVRYRTGDLAVQSDRLCECGRGLPLIEKIEGRRLDVVRTPSGQVVGGFFWTWLSRAVPGIARFQIEQQRLDGIIFRLVPGPEWKDDYKGVLEEKIKDNCGKDFNVAFIITDDILLTASGKVRIVMSNINERMLIKSKIHKAFITGESSGEVDCIRIDEELMSLAGISRFEKVLVVDMTNGERVETFAVEAERNSGIIETCGDAARHIGKGDEVSIMAFAWSRNPSEEFKNILVDRSNRFVRYLTDQPGKTIEE